MQTIDISSNKIDLKSQDVSGLAPGRKGLFTVMIDKRKLSVFDVRGEEQEEEAMD
jgi:hypothetical protein